jgi:hypothetical protein
MPYSSVMKLLRRSSMIVALYSIGILEGYFLPRYGIEWMLAAIGATAFLGGYWLRARWDL